MKKLFITFLTLAVLASCSSPKYAYHFDTYDYNSGKKPISKSLQEPSTLKIDERTLVASTDETLFFVAEPKAEATTEVTKPVAKEEAIKSFKALSKQEKKAFRKELKEGIKDYVKAKKSEEYDSINKGGLDNDLKLAAIFGAIGLVLLIIGGDIGIVGVIALLVGLFFLVRYLMRQ
ncbi:MAG: hypothetical protein L0Y35_04620 [Flammeovirgaceae bacterium]|nr:hypothetical protein [Flammeovirgaceae bacterium]